MKKIENFISIDELNRISAVGIQIIDRNGILICYSKGCEIIEGYRQKDVLGKNIQELYTQNRKRNPRFDFQQPAVVDRVFETQKEQRNIFVSYSIKGSIKIINTICDGYPVFDEAGNIKYVIIIYSNVSDYLKMMEKINQLKSELDQKTWKKRNNTQYTFDQIVGVSHQFKNVIKEAKEIAKNDGSVLIVGETGTGKELFAQSIHNESTRCDQKFVALNCSAIPENLMETMLFGSCKGAYTGAVNQKGLLEEAEGGTLFLDEINSMPLELQAKLLRLLETKRYRKVGSSEEKQCNIRFISAMNQFPKTAIKNKQMRVDLYYRIGMFVLTIPPLRYRPVDIRCLASYFTRTIAASLGKRAIQVSDDLMEMFLTYSWQGNVRELKHVIMQCIYLAKDSDLYIEPHHLRSNEVESFYREEKNNQEKIERSDETDLNKNLAEYEKVLIIEALERNDKNISKTARFLNITRQSLHGKIKKYSIEVKKM